MSRASSITHVLERVSMAVANAATRPVIEYRSAVT
jgi:hypothetical protein